MPNNETHQEIPIDPEAVPSTLPDTLGVSIGRIASQTVTIDEYRAGLRPVVDYPGYFMAGDKKIQSPTDPDDPRLLNVRSGKYFKSTSRVY